MAANPIDAQNKFKNTLQRLGIAKGSTQGATEFRNPEHPQKPSRHGVKDAVPPLAQGKATGAAFNVILPSKRTITIATDHALRYFGKGRKAAKTQGIFKFSDNIDTAERCLGIKQYNKEALECLKYLNDSTTSLYNFIDHKADEFAALAEDAKRRFTNPISKRLSRIFTDDEGGVSEETFGFEFLGKEKVDIYFPHYTTDAAHTALECIIAYDKIVACFLAWKKFTSVKVGSEKFEAVSSDLDRITKHINRFFHETNVHIKNHLPKLEKPHKALLPIKDEKGFRFKSAMDAAQKVMSNKAFLSRLSAVFSGANATLDHYLEQMISTHEQFRSMTNTKRLKFFSDDAISQVRVVTLDEKFSKVVIVFNDIAENITQAKRIGWRMPRAFYQSFQSVAIDLHDDIETIIKQLNDIAQEYKRAEAA